MANFRCFGLLVAYWRRSLTKGYRPYYFYFNFQLDEQLVSAVYCLTSLYLVASIRIMPFLFVLFFFMLVNIKKKKSMKVSLVVSNLVSTVLSYLPGNEGWVLLLVLRQLLLTRFCSVVCSVFSIFLFFFITSFGDCTRSQHQEIYQVFKQSGGSYQWEGEKTYGRPLITRIYW